MFEDVCLLTTNSSSELFEQMVRIGKDDVIIGISFPRYSMRTLKALEFANNRSAKVITITDSIHSPMNLYSSCNLIADSDMASIVDSLVAPLSVINALIVALCMKKQNIVAKTLTELEDIWNEYQVYENDEIDYIDESEVLSPADDVYHIDKRQFKVAICMRSQRFRGSFKANRRRCFHDSYKRRTRNRRCGTGGAPHAHDEQRNRESGFHA